METVRGSDRPWEPHPGCRHRRRTRAPECWRACSTASRSTSTPSPGASETSMKPLLISTGSVEHVELLQWVVRIAREREVRGRRHEMGIRHRRRPELGPAPDRTPLSCCIRERRDLPGPRQAARLRRVDDEDVARLRLDQLQRGADVRAALVGCDRNADRASHLSHALDVEVRHRLLDVLEVEVLEPADPLDRGGDAPDHVRVDPDLDGRSDLVADRCDRVVILAEVPPDLQLQLRVAGVDERCRLAGVRLGLVDEQVADDGNLAAAEATEQLGDRNRRAPCP